MNRLDRYVWSVFAVGALVATLSLIGSEWPRGSGSDLAVVAVLAAGLAIGEWFPVSIWRGDTFREYTFSGTFAVALVITGPLWVALLAQSIALLVEEVRRNRPPVKIAFNVSQYALTLVAARMVYAALTGEPLAGQSTHFSPSDVLPSLAAASVYFLVNAALVSVVLALANAEPVASTMAGHLREELSMTTTLLCVAPIIVVSLQFSLVSAALCILPILAVRQGARSAARSDVQAMHDSLTGLPNRSLLVQRIDRAIEMAPTGGQAGLLLLDLDHFKQINDTLGHPVGDQLLKMVAERLLEGVRPGDTVARLGGDEFAILCPGLSDASVAEAVADRLAEALAAPFPLGQVTLHVEASIGIALHPEHADGVDQLIQRADVALYQAKVERGTSRTYDPHHDFNSVERLALMEELRSGFATQLLLHYQPKCRTSDGTVVGVEALVRWAHPVRGLLAPNRFIPAAETAGLIVPMTMHILTESLRQVRRWQDEGLHLTVAVNISPRHLTDHHLPDQVADLLDQLGLPPEVLMLEVTESSMMSDPARAAQVLRRLRALGVSVSIDDFGTGYSSLAYLRDLSATEVKIDRTFVSQAVTSERDLAIVRATVQLGHSLGLDVVAEGVEDTTTAALMATAGCDLLQGYLILPPVPADELSAWCRRPQVWSRALQQQPVPTAPEVLVRTSRQ